MVAEQTKQKLSECGIPQRVISDNGIQFIGEAYQRFVCTWGIEHVTKSAGYPMPNEILERAMRTVKNTLDKARKTGIDSYFAMLSIRVIKYPPNLLLGRKLQINMPSYATPPDNREIIMQQLTQGKHSQELYLDICSELGKDATSEAGKYLFGADNVWWRCAQYFDIASCG